jgi:hypothetical protein
VVLRRAWRCHATALSSESEPVARPARPGASPRPRSASGFAPGSTTALPSGGSSRSIALFVRKHLFINNLWEEPGTSAFSSKTLTTAVYSRCPCPESNGVDFWSPGWYTKPSHLQSLVSF